MSRIASSALLLLVLTGCAFTPLDTRLVDGKRTFQAIKQGNRWQFANGEYEGSLSKGQPQGHGTFYLRDGRRIEADFDRGTSKAGKVWDSTGELIYEGAFSDNAPPSRVQFDLPEGRFSGLSFGGLHAIGVLQTSNGEKWELATPLQKNKPHGMATLTASNQDVHRQPFKEGLREGQGDWTPKTGFKWIQYWRQNHLSYQHPDPLHMQNRATECATPFQGQWYLDQGICQNGSFKGEVRLYSLDGQDRLEGLVLSKSDFVGSHYQNRSQQSWQGTFSNGQPHGALITHKIRNNTVYVGPFNNGLYEGKGSCRYVNNMEACEHLAGRRVDAIHLTRLEQERIATERRREEARRERERREAQEARERRAWEKRKQAEAEQASKDRQLLLSSINQAVKRASNELQETNRKNNLAIQKAMLDRAGSYVDYNSTTPSTQSSRSTKSGTQPSNSRSTSSSASSKASYSSRSSSTSTLTQQRAAEARKREAEQQRIEAEAQREEVERQRTEEKLRLAEEQKQREAEQQRQAEEKRRQAEQKRAEEKARREEEKRQREEEKKQAENRYLEAMRQGIRLVAHRCPGGEGQYYVSGIRPRTQEVVGCINVEFEARCPGQSTGITNTARNFLGASTDCFMGDAVKIQPKPSCKLEEVRLSVRQVSKCFK